MREGWEYKKLGELVQVLNGYAFKSSLYENQGIRVLRITNVQKGNIVDDDPKYYPLSLTDEIRNYLLKESDLLMSLTGNVGRVGLLTKDMLPAALNQRVACLRILSNGLNLGFLFHYLNSDKFEQDAVLSAKGIAQKNMSTEWLKDYKLPLPPISVQQSIVSEIDKINELIRLKKDQLKDYDNLAQSIFYEMFGDEKYERRKLKNIVKVKSGQVSPLEDPYCDMVHVGPANIESNTGRLINLKTAKEENLISGKYLFDSSMVLYSKIRPNLNKVTIADFEGICSADMYPLIPSKSIDKKFLLFILKQKEFLSYAIANSGRANIPKINREDLLEYSTILPPLSLQLQFAERLALIEKQKEQISSIIKDLETLLASRMQYWFD